MHQPSQATSFKRCKNSDTQRADRATVKVHEIAQNGTRAYSDFKACFKSLEAASRLHANELYRRKKKANMFAGEVSESAWKHEIQRFLSEMKTEIAYHILDVEKEVRHA